MTLKEWNGTERRIEPGLDIKKDGKYGNIIGKSYYSDYYGETDFKKYIPADVLEQVNDSEGRLRIRTLNTGDPYDSQEEAYTQFVICSVERRKKTAEND